MWLSLTPSSPGLALPLQSMYLSWVSCLLHNWEMFLDVIFVELAPPEDPVVRTEDYWRRPSREGSRSRSRVRIVRCTAPGWCLCRTESSLSGSPWLASQVYRAWGRVSGVLVWGEPHSWQSGLRYTAGIILWSRDRVGITLHRVRYSSSSKKIDYITQA